VSRNIIGRGKKSLTVMIPVAGVMAAIVCISTMLVQIPIPASEGYFNIGDAMVFVTALLFGPVVGGFSGGVGSALSDVISGFGVFAPTTLIVKGLEGTLAGLLSNGVNSKRDILGVIVGGAEMVIGYFISESVFLGFGVSGAIGELPFNVVQVTVGGIVGVSLTLIVRRYLGPITHTTKR
jgi:uncharacterized membrane protein